MEYDDAAERQRSNQPNKAGAMRVEAVEAKTRQKANDIIW
jgi:hypothetical protein